MRLAPVCDGRIALVIALCAALLIAAAVDGAASCSVVQGVAKATTLESKQFMQLRPLSHMAGNIV